MKNGLGQYTRYIKSILKLDFCLTVRHQLGKVI